MTVCWSAAEERVLVQQIVDIAASVQTLAKRSRERRITLGCSAGEPPDDRHRRLLRARRQGPRRCRAADERDELAPSYHSITSSARANTESGTLIPSVFAVLRLMTSSNLVDCITGRSAGLIPFRIRPA